MHDIGYAVSNFDDAPTVLIFSDSDQGAATQAEIVNIVGGRIAANITIGDALARLDQQVAMAAVLIDIRFDHGALLDRLLDRLDGLARLDDVCVIISVPMSLVDIVSARATSGGVTILCDPDQAEAVSALTLGVSEKAMMLSDITAEIDSVRLRRLADEVSRIARALSTISSQGPARGMTGHVNDMHVAFRAEPADNALAPDMPSAPEIRRLIRLRRVRENFFEASLFADPAWDMLLDLMAARIEEDRVAVSSLCIAASVPPTTALRWIKAMSDSGLFERHADPDDGRRIFIRLSESAAAAMARYFSAIKKAGGWGI